MPTARRPAISTRRYDNPTVVAVETEARRDRRRRGVARLRARAWRRSSTALFGLLEAGDEVVCCAAIYGGTFHVLHRAGRALRRRPRGSPRSRSSARPARSSARRRGWCGSSRRSTRRCAASTWRAVADACRAAGVLSVIDNTFASPINQPVLAMGVDLSMQSVTKYLNGHSDVTGGVLSGRAGAHRPAGQDAAAARRHPRPAAGLRARPRHEDAARCASPVTTRRRWRWRRRSKGTRRWPPCTIPGWPSHPDHAIATAQMTRLRRHGVPRSGGRAGGGVPRLRPPAADPARGQPGRRREPVQPADPDLAVRPRRRGAGRGPASPAA